MAHISPALLFGRLPPWADVHYNYDRGTNFAAYKTYQWVVLPDRRIS